MSIVSYILIYLFVGALFCLIIDMINTYYNNRGDIREEKVDFSNLERFILTIVWPYGLCVFLFNLYKNLRK